MKFLTLIICVAVGTWVHAEVVDLGSHGQFDIATPPGWRCEAVSGGERVRHLTFTPVEAVPAKAMITLFCLPKPRPVIPAEVDRELELACDIHVPTSVEQAVSLKHFSLGRGYGVYSVFTDAALVGQPTKPGDFKVMTTGVIRFTPTVMAVVSLFAEAKDGEPMQTLVRMIESATLHDQPLEAESGNEAL